MKILYIPLDERPCNALYPIKAAQVNQDVEIISPEPELLGQKKTPGTGCFTRFCPGTLCSV